MKELQQIITNSENLTGDVEKYGTGFIRIRKYLEEYPDVSYSVSSDGYFVQVIVYERKVTQETPQETPQDTLQDTPQVKSLLKVFLGEMTIPRKPTSRNQKYRLTTKGKERQ